MDFRKIFDTIPEEFDKWRPRYCEELFADMLDYAGLGSSGNALEIGPGTGKATEPVFKSGCSYLAIELGEHLAALMKDKFRSYDNFQIVNADFETYDFGHQQFDLVYSAATIQWIPEKVGFPKVYDLVKNGGAFAMMMTRTDYKSPNEALFAQIQEVYKEHFRPETPYTCKLTYDNVLNYGFTDFECRSYHKTRAMTADDFVAYIGTHCDHIALQEPHRTAFYEGVRDVIRNAGNRIILQDDIVLYLVRKP